MNQQKLKTNKFFYGKWPYKILCVVGGAWRVKRLGVNETIKYCLSDPEMGAWVDRGINKPMLMEFAQDIEPFLDKEIQIRCEGSSFNIYCKDTDLFNRIRYKLGGWIKKTWEPSEVVNEFYSSNSNKKILCNHLPYHTYRYKVFLKPNTATGIKESFFKWVKNYDTKIKVTPYAEKWLNNGQRWWSGIYIYVEDQATLSMIGLFLGNGVSKVQEFIPISSINILINQEQECPV